MLKLFNTSVSGNSCVGVKWVESPKLFKFNRQPYAIKGLLVKPSHLKRNASRGKPLQIRQNINSLWQTKLI